MEQESQDAACIVNDMSDLVVVDLDSAVKVELDTENGLSEVRPHILDITQGLW